MAANGVGDVKVNTGRCSCRHQARNRWGWNPSDAGRRSARAQLGLPIGSLVSLGEGIECMTPAGKLQLHILAALAEFERGRIQERVMASLARARAQGKRLGTVL